MQTALRRFGSIALLGALSAPLVSSAFPIAAGGTGFAVLAGSTADIIATYEGYSAAYSNDLYLVTDDGVVGNDIFIFNNHNAPVGSTKNLGSFAVGTELVFRLHVNDTGRDFYTGAAARNPDNQFHANVQENWALNTTLVSFEDLFDGPFNFNDLSFSFLNTVAATPDDPNQIPEPATLGLMGLGLGLAALAAARRRRAGRSEG